MPHHARLGSPLPAVPLEPRCPLGVPPTSLPFVLPYVSGWSCHFGLDIACVYVLVICLLSKKASLCPRTRMTCLFTAISHTPGMVLGTQHKHDQMRERMSEIQGWAESLCQKHDEHGSKLRLCPTSPRCAPASLALIQEQATRTGGLSLVPSPSVRRHPGPLAPCPA